MSVFSKLPYDVLQNITTFFSFSYEQYEVYESLCSISSIDELFFSIPMQDYKNFYDTFILLILPKLFKTHNLAFFERLIDDSYLRPGHFIVNHLERISYDKRIDIVRLLHSKQPFFQENNNVKCEVGSIVSGGSLSILHWYLGLLNEYKFNSFVITRDIVYRYIKDSIENNNFEMLIYLDKHLNSICNKSYEYWFDYIFRHAICQANISVVKWLVEKKIALSNDKNLQLHKNELFVRVEEVIQRELSVKEDPFLWSEDDFYETIEAERNNFTAIKITVKSSERIVSYFQNHPVFRKFF